MRLLTYFYRYGITDPKLLDVLTRENWFTVEVPEAVLQATQQEYALSNYYAGDSIFVQQEELVDIQVCAKVYRATNYDELIANSIKKGLLVGREELFNRILCTHKIEAALGDAVVTGIVVTELYPNIGLSSVEILPKTTYNSNIAFTNLSSFLLNKGKAYNREAYNLAAATDVALIAEVHQRFDIRTQDRVALYLNAMLERNGPLAKFLSRQITTKNLNFLIERDNDLTRQLCVSAMVIGDNDLIQRTFTLLDQTYDNYISYCTNLDALAHYTEKNADDLGLCTAATLANIELLDFWLGRSDNEANIAEIAYGAAAGGNGAILDVTLTVMMKLKKNIPMVLRKLLTIAYCFDNYHCIAIIAKYDQNQELKTRGLAHIPNDDLFANQYCPDAPPFPAHWDAWYDSFYTDGV
jgi:hypothetical protein